MPERIQRKRTKGWRMPQDAIYVGRPSRWGNDWTLADARAWGVLKAEQPFWVVEKFRADMHDWLRIEGSYWRDLIAQLRGRDLACWCPLDQPCHADVLLELANSDALSAAASGPSGLLEVSE